MARPFAGRSSVAGLARTSAVTLVVACAALLATSVSATAGGTLVGKASITGELSGKVTAPRLRTASDGVEQYGCQISPNEDTMVVNNYLPAKLRVDGRSETVSVLQLFIVLIKDGNKESLAPIGGSNFVNGVNLIIRAGGRDYAWSSNAGTISSTAGARAGSFSAEMQPEGSPLVPQAGKTAATTPIHMTGSWTGCHAGQ